jgi:hypothetical protein
MQLGTKGTAVSTAISLRGYRLDAYERCRLRGAVEPLTPPVTAQHHANDSQTTILISCSADS